MLEAIKSGRPEFIGRFLANSLLSKKHPYACAQYDFQHIKPVCKMRTWPYNLSILFAGLYHFAFILNYLVNLCC